MLETGIRHEQEEAVVIGGKERIRLSFAGKSETESPRPSGFQVVLGRLLPVKGLLCLLLLAGLFYGVVNQPYYHAGLDVTIREKGFLVRNTAQDSAASAAGILPGMYLAFFDGINIPEFDRSTEARYDRLFAVTAALFRIGSPITVVTDRGEEFSFTPGRLPLRSRVSLVTPTIVHNFFAGFLFILGGLFLSFRGGARKEIILFTLFSYAAGLGLALSFFNAYWTHSFLFLWFILLDICTVSAGLFLLLFVLHFPVPWNVRLRLSAILSLLPLPVKYAILAVSGGSPVGSLLYFASVSMFLALTAALTILLIRYRTLPKGHQRRVRWVLAGAVFSLIPYLLYVLFNLVRGNLFAEELKYLNSAAAYALLLFPATAITGMLRFNLFDIDGLLYRVFSFVIYLAAVFVLYRLGSVLFPEPAGAISLTTLAGLLFCTPLLYRFISKWSVGVFDRSLRGKKEMLDRLETSITGLVHSEKVYALVADCMKQVFDPAGFSLALLRPDGSLSTVCRNIWAGSDDEQDEFQSSRDRNRNPAVISHLSGGVSAPLLSGDRLKGFVYLGRKINEDYYTPRETAIILSLCRRVSGALDNCELYRRFKLSEENTILAQKTAIVALAKLAEYRDQVTGKHLERIGEYSRILGKGLMESPSYADYISPSYLEDLYFSSVLHDIGKVGIPDRILNKPGKLTPPEFERIKAHTVIGGRVLEDSEKSSGGISFLSLGKVIAYYHHEKWDGSGYPEGLKGTKIPLAARIIAVADVYDALTSRRPYKKAFPHEVACRIIVAESGTHFDPDIVNVFSNVHHRFDQVRQSLQ